MNEPSATKSSPQKKKSFNFWQCFWLSFLVVSLAFAWYSYYVPSNSIAWAGDYQSAVELSAETDKPIILYFTGTWCVPCRIMKRQVWADDEVTKLVNAEYVPLAIDVDNPDYAELMETYKIGGPPVTIVTDSDGNALCWRAGGIGKAEFFELLKESKDGSKPEAAVALTTDDTHGP